MEDIVSSVRELIAINNKLVEQNQQIVDKLQAIESDLRSSREEQIARKRLRAERFRQMDIAYVMKHKGVSAEEAAQNLQENGYNVEKTLRTFWGSSEYKLEYILSFYERKNNQAIIEMW